MRCCTTLLLAVLAAGSTVCAGPVDFGLNEVNAALASRNLKWKLKYELNLEGPDSFRIEPYGYGGGHVTGGDMRGLMYGLLEAADQIRATGRLALMHSTPAIPLRAVRQFVSTGDLNKYSEDFWRDYFQTLARSRLNRFTLVFLSANPFPLLVEVNGFPDAAGAAEQRDRNIAMLRFISQTAAEYAVDFTVGFWETDSPAPTGAYAHDALLKLLAECPAIRSIEMRPLSADAEAYRDSVFKALHEVGRRVALDPRGALLDPAVEKAAQEAGVALRVSPESWPPGFEIDPPPGPGHELFYRMWGRLAYDPKAKPPHAIAVEEYRLAAQIVGELRDGLIADPDMYLWPEVHPGVVVGKTKSTDEPDDFVATIPEAVRDRLGNIASAKQTPVEIADALSAASAGLEESAVPDFQLLAELARYHAHRLRAAYDLELFDQLKNPAVLDHAAEELKQAQQSWKPGDNSLQDAAVLASAIEQRRKVTDVDPSKQIPEPGKIDPRPQVAHIPVKNIAAEQPITLSIQVNPLKNVREVRLHYRAVDSREWKTIGKPAGALLFTIPAADLAPDSQLVYYFEILNRENGGWFEPDPLTAVPYHWVRVAPK